MIPQFYRGDQATDPRARRIAAGCGIIRGAHRRALPPTTRFLPRMKFMYGNIRASITHVEYHDQQLEALPVTTLRRKMYFSARHGGGKVEIRARTTLPFSRAIRFLQPCLLPREPVVEPKPLESSSTTLQAFTDYNLRTLPISPRIFRSALDSRDAPRNVCSCFMHAR